MMAFKFENLTVWQKALELSNMIDKLSQQFPKIEIYALSSQIKRASDSVVLNIAERSTSQSSAEFKRFLNMALRSAIEVVACLFLARSRSYLDELNFKDLYDKYEVLCRMISKLRDSLH